MKLNKIFTIVLLFLCLAFLVACTQNINKTDQKMTTSQNTTKQTTQSSTPQTTLPQISTATNINDFSAVEEGEKIRLYFLLEDANGKNTISAGHIKLDILDDVNNSLYSKEFDVTTADFVDYQFSLTGKEMGKAYEWRIQNSEIKKGIASYYGNAILTFTNTNSKKMTAETSIKIPAYTDEELVQMSEDQYQLKAKTINKKRAFGDFEVVVTKVGFYETYEYSKKKQYFRADMEVKNVGSESEYFSPSGMSVIDGSGNQYESSYGGTLDTFSKMYPDIIKKGYVLFDEIPQTLNSGKIMFELGYDSSYDPYLFEYSFTLS